MLEIVGGYVYGGVILAGDHRIVCVRPLLHDPNSNYKRKSFNFKKSVEEIPELVSFMNYYS